jgi:putative CocE/NonD family hydrolase
MRDGIVLRSDVFTPGLAGPLPVLVCRTAYGKRGEAFGGGYPETATGLARRGYIVVVQDVRGRYASDGVYRWLYGPGAAEDHAQDGYDTIQWAATLPKSSGQVGTWGNSYDGYTSLRAAGAAPPSLSAAFASGVAERLHDETFGIFKPIYLEWTRGMAADLRARAGKPASPTAKCTTPVATPTVLGAESARPADASAWPDDMIWTLPYDAITDDIFADLSAPFKRSLREQEIDYWALDETEPNISVPVCHLTGWWDYVCRGTVAHFTGLRERGAEGLRGQHRLTIGPWSHRTGRSAAGAGAVDYGPAERVHYHDEIADWYDYVIKGDDQGSYCLGTVKVFILNENRWRWFETWPIDQALHTRFFLHSQGSANTPRGDGRLSLDEPATAAKPSRYVYDPRDPVISLSDWSSRAIDQSARDQRKDVLVYVSEPLARSLLVIGDASCTLWVSTDAPETDFTAKLVEVRPDGLSVELATGIIRTRFLDGYDAVVRLEPGTPYQLTIGLGPVGVRLQSGSRIRLDISSSDFPNFDRNHNTGADYWSDPELRPARQTVYSDATCPAFLTLPICPGD